jgi:hypothetical protein
MNTQTRLTNDFVLSNFAALEKALEEGRRLALCDTACAADLEQADFEVERKMHEKEMLKQEKEDELSLKKEMIKTYTVTFSHDDFIADNKTERSFTHKINVKGDRTLSIADLKRAVEQDSFLKDKNFEDIRYYASEV